MMNKIFRFFFRKYEEDDISVYVHSGVGYAGIDYDLYNGQPARQKHQGVGYGGLYE